MTGIAVKSHRGMVPRRSDRLLADTQAIQATNCKITSGKLVPINAPLLSHTSLAASLATIWRYRFGSIDNWLVSTSVADFARSPVSGDSQGRVYWTGDGEPRMSTYAQAISGGGPYPTAWYVLGVVPPVTTMAISVVGGVAADESRAYVYTFVTALGEESGPSPALFKTGKSDGSWNISLMDAAPPNNGTISNAVKDTPSAGYVEVTLDTVFGLQAGEKVTFASVAGMTDLNGTFTLVTVTSATNKVVVALTTTQTYSAAADTWTRVAPHNTTSMTKRIYRTVGTNTDYKLVAEIAVATTTYNDTIASTALGDAIPTLYARTPPKDGHSLIALANGCHAMLSGNQICLSDPYMPHSYPTRNRYPFPAKGVALASAGNSAIILTDTFPYILTATTPESGSVSQIETYAPCVAKQSVVDTGQGCLYASHDGLYSANTSAAVCITAGLYKKDEWEALNPTTFKAAFHMNGYYASHAVDSGPDAMLFLDMTEPDSAIEFDESADCLHTSPYDGNLYIGNVNKVYQWDGDTANRKTMYWRSKNFTLPKPINFACGQVFADWGDIVPVNTTVQDANTALMATVESVKGSIADAQLLDLEICGSMIQKVSTQTAGFVQFTLLADDVVKYTVNLTSDAMFRLPATFISRVQGWQIAANIPVHAEFLTQSPKELQAV